MGEKEINLGDEISQTILSDLKEMEGRYQISINMNEQQLLNVILHWSDEITASLNKAYETKPSKTFTGFFDGSAIPNPGEMQCGYIIYDHNGRETFRGSSKLGYGTNNRAEYCGLIKLLESAIKEKISHLIVHGDSEVAIKQMTHEYRVKEPKLKLLWAKAQKLVSEFESVKFVHVPRKENFIADNLSRT